MKNDNPAYWQAWKDSAIEDKDEERLSILLKAEQWADKMEELMGEEDWRIREVIVPAGKEVGVDKFTPHHQEVMIGLLVIFWGYSGGFKKWVNEDYCNEKGI